MLDEIDRFLNYEMIPEEESDFIARMEKDEVLREQVFLRQLVVEAESKNLVPEKAGKEEIVSKGSGPLDSSLFMRADDTWLLLRENVSFQYPGRFA